MMASAEIPVSVTARPVFVIAVGHDLDEKDAERIQQAVAMVLAHPGTPLVTIPFPHPGYFGLYRDDRRIRNADRRPSHTRDFAGDLPGAIAAFAQAAADPECTYASLEYLNETKSADKDSS